jgi:DnaK suppressor protein
MRKIFLNKIKTILEDERIGIVAELKQQNTNLDIDIDGDETDEIQGKNLALAISQIIARKRTKLFHIENALKKISEGNFGYCEECGEEISEKRLLVNPGFITCIGCAERIELMNKRNRR